jgi:hypothetical protein
VGTSPHARLTICSEAAGINRQNCARSPKRETGTSAIDASGHIAFQYTLANGVSGIAIAAVPEPASLGVLALGIMTILHRRSRTS